METSNYEPVRSGITIDELKEELNVSSINVQTVSNDEGKYCFLMAQGRNIGTASSGLKDQIDNEGNLNLAGKNLLFGEMKEIATGNHFFVMYEANGKAKMQSL